MTTLRNSQLAGIGVAANPAAAGMRSSQMAAIGVASNPAAAGLRFSQLVAIAVTANGSEYKELGPAIALGCWTPCGTLLYNGR